MKKVGIWIDKREAKLVTIEAGKEHYHTIASEIEEFNISGGSGTKSKGGPQDVVQDSKYLEREQHQFATFFNELAESLADADSIVIFGPAQAGEKLNEALSEKHPKLYAKVSAVKKADNMSDNQVKAWVRDFFAADN